MKDKQIRVCISYDRVSTFDQAYNPDGTERKDSSPEAQKQRCLDQMAHLITKTKTQRRLAEHISDKAYSGKDTNRPGYQRLWDLIGSGQIDEVIATELSRLSRSVYDFLDLVAHCEKNKVDLIIIGLDLDTSTPFGKVIVIILVALAQFEREMTGVRVRENALARLLKDGKINGAAEILGLDRDPEHRGHFLVNHEELLKVEKILNLFIKLSSKTKVLRVAKELGLTGKKGRELGAHQLDTLLENVKWRYQGLWYANNKNKDFNQSSLSDTKKYQIVKLPHGPLIENQELLKAVEAKIADTYSKKKRSGKDDHTYLLSHILHHEDGTRYTGQPGKNRQYRYYYNKDQKIRIRCDELDKLVLAKIKNNILNDEKFTVMLEEAVKRRKNSLPKIDIQIRSVEESIDQLQATDRDLQAQLLNPLKRGAPDFMEWLQSQVKEINQRRNQLSNDLDSLRRFKEEANKEVGLDNLKKTASTFLGKFDDLSGTERRNILEKIVHRIVVKSGNQLEIQFYGEPKASSKSVAGRKKSTGREEIGVSNVQVWEHPDAIKTVLVRWNGVKIDLTKLARLRWIEKKKSHELCQVFGLRRTAINRSIRTLRNAGISGLNLSIQEKKLIEKQINLENKIYGGNTR